MILNEPNGITIRNLKDFLAGMPDTNEHGEPYEVWVDTGPGLSSLCVELSNLNQGDLLLGPRKEAWDEPGKIQREFKKGIAGET